MKLISAGLLLTLGCATIPSSSQEAPNAFHDTARIVTKPAYDPSKPFYDGYEEQANKEWRVVINAKYDPKIIDTLVQVEQRKDGEITQSSEHARAGKYSLKKTVPHQFGSFRTEIALLPAVPAGVGYWYGFSIYLPKDWQVDSQNNILAQWHHYLPLTFHSAPGSGRPPLALSVLGNRWILTSNWNPNGDGSSGKDAREDSYDLGAIQPGVWVDYVAHITWSADTNGLIQLWKDGKMLLNHHGPDMYSANTEGPYFQMGIYHPQWNPHERPNALNSDKEATRAIVVYDDEVRIAPEPATYNDVKPRGDHPF